MEEVDEDMKDIMDLEDLEFIETRRNHRWNHIRLNWEEHVLQLQHENRFHREYRMSLNAFNHLKTILFPLLKRDWKRSNCIEPVCIEIIMGVGLRYLGGGAMLDIRHVFKISLTEAYHSMKCFVTAVNLCPGLSINLPENAVDLESIRKGFYRKSSNGLMDGCVGGFFQQIQ